MVTGKVAYIDCFSGISGDMFVSALFDAGFPLEELEKTLAAVDIGGYRLHSGKKNYGPLAATFFEVEAAPQPRRKWAEIRDIIAAGGLNEPVKQNVLSVFGELARAEARVHGCSEEDVHFHEIGAVDTIIDIIATVAGLDYLGIHRLIAAPLPMARGWVDCEHGRLPLPAPAVCEIITGVPVYGDDSGRELVTPTGAALVKVLCHEFGAMPAMIVEKTAYGGGSHVLPDSRPNILRLIVGKSLVPEEAQEVDVIETNIDDWSPEGMAYLSEALMAKGALDVSLSQVQMKKGRPGFQLQVIAEPAASQALREYILSESTAIGLRYHRARRLTLPRQKGFIKSRWGKLAVKRVETPVGPVLYPEYEACREVARSQEIPLKMVYAEVRRYSPDDFTPFSKGDK